MVKLEIKKLYEIVEQEEKEGRMGDKTYWSDLWKDYIEEKSGDYMMLDVKEAMSRFVSEQNLRLRRNVNNCGELGVDIRVGDICYIDYGEAYINEIGYQHFGIILSIFHNKAFVVPMSGNRGAFQQAYGKDNPEGKRHLMRLGKMEGMNKESVLFINDAKFINTARIIDVKAHLDRRSPLFHDIKERVKMCLD
ncbi:hypothetical protein ACWG0P_03415 [Amedibacillus sp. YH-ame6]